MYLICGSHSTKISTTTTSFVIHEICSKINNNPEKEIGVQPKVQKRKQLATGSYL